MRNLSLLLIVFIFSVLAACGGGSSLSEDEINATAAVLVKTIAAEAAASGTPEPVVASPLPEGSQMLLLAPAEADPARVSAAASAVQALADARGWAFSQREHLTASDLAGGTRLVIAVAPDNAGLAALAANTPGVQFIGIGLDGLTPADNLTLIALGTVPAAELGFIAGYYSAILTDSYRVGALTINEGVGVDIRQGFLNGARYFCGLCSPGFPPFHPYPLYEEVPTGADFNTLQNAARLLVDSAVQTLFLAPGGANPDLVGQLAAQNINLIGTSLPAEADQGNWALVISAGDLGATLANIIPEILLNGAQGVITLEPSVWHNPERVSAGRYARGLHIIHDLSRGIIDPLGD
jgi:hypothetical protein